MKEYKIDEKLEGKRLDEALLALGEGPSRSQIQRRIKEKRILLNGKDAKPATIVCVSDIITCEENTNNQPRGLAQEIPVDVVYEDEDLLIINKQRGLLVHPGNGHPDGTLVNALLGRGTMLAMGSDSLRPGIVHRIDKDTTGLLCVAKSELAFRSLAEQLKDHSMHREYVALVDGNIPERAGKIDAPIGRDPKDPIRFAVCPENGKEAVTFFEVLRRYEEKLTLVSCRLLTGRTHQIRVHMAYIGHPVEGDPLYGQNNKRFFKDGQLLHAYRLSFKHPRTGKEVSFFAPLPDDFKKALSGLHPLFEQASVVPEADLGDLLKGL